MLPGKPYSPVDYAAMAWRRRWVIAVPALLGLYAALIVSSRLPNTYQSEMLIQIVPQRIPDSYIRSTITMRTEDRITSLEEQIKSRTEIERLITQMNLYPDERARLPMQDVVEMMRSKIKVDIVGTRNNQDPDSFYVRFEYSDPQVVTRVTERLGAMFIDANSRDRGNLAQATDNFLQGQLADARRRLEEQDQKLKEFRERNSGRLPTQLAFNMQAMQAAQMQAQALVESIARDKDRKLMLERLYNDALAEPVLTAQQPVQAQGQPLTPAPAPPTGTASQQLTAARDTLRMLELNRTADHPDIRRTKSLIARLEAQVEQDAAAAAAAAAAAGPSGAPAALAVPATAAQNARSERLAQMAAEIESLQRQIAFKEAQEQPLRDRLSQVQQRIEQVPSVESEWIALTRDYDTQQAAYKDLLAKSDDARRAAELEQRQIGEQFRILDPARMPVRPTGVNRLEVNAMGAGVGLGLGLLLAALLELRDRTFRSAADVVDVFKLPVVAMVPNLPSAADVRRARFRRLVASAAVAALVLAGGVGFWKLELWRHIA